MPPPCDWPNHKDSRTRSAIVATEERREYVRNRLTHQSVSPLTTFYGSKVGVRRAARSEPVRELRHQHAWTQRNFRLDELIRGDVRRRVGVGQVAAGKLYRPVVLDHP